MGLAFSDGREDVEVVRVYPGWPDGHTKHFHNSMQLRPRDRLARSRQGAKDAGDETPPIHHGSTPTGPLRLDPPPTGFHSPVSEDVPDEVPSEPFLYNRQAPSPITGGSGKADFGNNPRVHSG